MVRLIFIFGFFVCVSMVRSMFIALDCKKEVKENERTSDRNDRTRKSTADKIHCNTSFAYYVFMLMSNPNRFKYFVVVKRPLACFQLVQQCVLSAICNSSGRGKYIEISFLKRFCGGLKFSGPVGLRF